MIMMNVMSFKNCERIHERTIIIIIVILMSRKIDNDIVISEMTPDIACMSIE